MDKATARRTGSPQYDGMKCATCGTTLRRLCNSACVQCQSVYSKQWKADHAENETARKRQWRKDHPERVTTSHINSHAKARGAKGYIEPEDLKRMRQAQHGRCAYCGSSDTLTLDHKTAVEMDGVHAIRNVQYLCLSCNMRKGFVKDDVYRRRNGIPTVTEWDCLIWRSEGL